MKLSNWDSLIAEINGLITMTEMAMSEDGNKIRLHNLKKEINKRLKLMDTRPKPSVKWPPRKDVIANGDGRGKSDEWSIGWNDCLDACQAAVEAAGLEYGLDEKVLERIILDNWDAMCSPKRLTR